MISMLSIPTLKFSAKNFTFNAACMKLMPDVEYVELFTIFEEGVLCIRGSQRAGQDSTPWRANCSGREIHAKKVKWPKLHAHICKNMNWPVDDTYTVPANLASLDNDPIIVFQLDQRKSANKLEFDREMKRLKKIGWVDDADGASL